jgi:phage head maturation protease
VKSGDLLEVSIVSFPACAQATMSVVKSSPQIASLANSPVFEDCMKQASRIKDLLNVR